MLGCELRRQRAPEIAVRMALAALGVILGLSGAAAGTGLMDDRRMV